MRLATPANADLPGAPQGAWKEHCLQMAYSTEALAYWCDDADMLRAYLDLAAKWKRKANAAQET